MQEQENTPQKNEKEENNNFECNICLDTAREPVITYCGHLFCWSCIFQWMKDQEKPCPICKSLISKDKLIPIYGRGNNQQDPRKKTEIPSRPSGQRTELPQQDSYNGFGQNYGPADNNFQFGFGVFPPLFGLQFQYHNGTRPMSPSNEQSEFSGLLFALGLFILFFIIFV